MNLFQHWNQRNIIGEYRAYGHYDGIGIGKKIEFQNGSSFEKIYTSCAESDSENMSYATQTLLGFFENEEKEHEFWQTDKPFLYIVLLQVVDNASTPFYKDMCDGKFLKNQYKEIGLNEKQWESTWSSHTIQLTIVIFFWR